MASFYMDTTTRIKHILVLLHKAYGRVPDLKLTDPIDEIIRTILSQNTSDINSLKAFAILKKRFLRWECVLTTPVPKIAALIQHAGLANIKAARITEVLAEIKKREGKLSLASLRPRDIGEAMEYLRSLKGIGPKTASCVLLFSFAKPVMPVDTHIFRVAKRLGLIAADTGIEDAHKLLSRIVPGDLIYEFHLGIIEHGRKTCGAHRPKCGLCVLYHLCRFEDKRSYK